MNQTLEERIEALEREVDLFKSLSKRREWYSLQEASEIIGCSVYYLRSKIKASQVNPRTSPYKEGKHWRIPGVRGYQVNVVNWSKI